MPDPTPGGRPAQFRSLFRSIVLDLDLLSHHVLAVANVTRIVAEERGSTADRIFTPLVTLCTSLSQILSDDHSCRDAVSRIIAHRAASGQAACSPNTASYCNARARVPLGVLRTLARRRRSAKGTPVTASSVFT